MHAINCKWVIYIICLKVWFLILAGIYTVSLNYEWLLILPDKITSSDNQFLMKVQSKYATSDKVRCETSHLVEANPLETDNYAKLTRARYLLICKTCLWCASYIKNQATYTKCPLCYNGEIDCMPIGEDKDGFFDYSHSKDVQLKLANHIRC